MKKNKPNKFIVISICYFIILLMISTAYSFFNTDLSITATTSISTKTGGNYEYDYILQSKWQDGKSYTYHFVPTITYLDTTPTIGWKIYVKVPLDTEIIGCWSAGSCIVEGEVLTMTNTTNNGVLSPENTSVSIPFQMKTNVSDYTFEIIGISFIENIDSETIEIPPQDNKDENNNNTNNNESIYTPINYIDPVLNITGGWGNTTTYILKINNNSNTNTIISWNADITFPQNSKISALWGGTYDYDEATGKLTIHGPDWSPSLEPNNTAEVNIYVDTGLTSPYTPIIGKFIGITSTGEKVETNINLGSDS